VVNWYLDPNATWEIHIPEYQPGMSFQRAEPTGPPRSIRDLVRRERWRDHWRVLGVHAPQAACDGYHEIDVADASLATFMERMTSD
jgi:hypothetical protein